MVMINVRVDLLGHYMQCSPIATAGNRFAATRKKFSVCWYPIVQWEQAWSVLGQTDILPHI